MPHKHILLHQCQILILLCLYPLVYAQAASNNEPPSADTTNNDLPTTIDITKDITEITDIIDIADIADNIDPSQIPPLSTNIHDSSEIIQSSDSANAKTNNTVLEITEEQFMEELEKSINGSKALFVKVRIYIGKKQELATATYARIT